MKSLSKATFHLLCCILLLGTFQSCKDDETTPPPPGESATLTISDVKAEANTVTFTITPKNVDVYTYTIKSATVTPQATVQDPAETKTFTYNSLLPSSDYTIVATGFTQGGLELTSTEYKFRTLDTQDPGLEVPSGEEPFIEYGDQRIAAKSVFFYKETDRLWFFISPLEGYDNYQDMLYGNGGKNDYISLSFTPNQLNKSINMKSASERYSLLNSMSFQHPIASDISMVTIDYHSLITDGGFIVTRDGDKIEGYAEMTSAATGKKLRIYGTCTYDQQDAERTSFISLNDLKTPLGSAYYQPLEEETISEIHLSPASPVMGALIDQVDEYYVRIRFDNALATAKTPIDITRIDKLFELEIVDPAQQKSVTVTNTDLQGATGTITLYKYALQDNYRISFDLQVHDMHLEGYADGAFELYSYYSGNSYTVGTNDPVELQSAVIDRRSDDYYTIYLAPQAGLTDLEQIRQAEGVVTIKAAPQALDGLLVSFANEKDAGRILSIAYAGKTYDNQGDNTKSTIHGATAKQKIALAFYEVTNEMNGYYCGPFVDVQ